MVSCSKAHLFGGLTARAAEWCHATPIPAGLAREGSGEAAGLPCEGDPVSPRGAGSKQ